jgi:Protein of unknown function (DUF3572)
MIGPKSEGQDIRDLADGCLHHLAGNPEQLAEFMSYSGLTPDSFRSAMGTESLARGLIDYFARNEALLLALCAESGRKPEAVMRVWARLNPAG